MTLSVRRRGVLSMLAGADGAVDTVEVAMRSGWIGYDAAHACLTVLLQDGLVKRERRKPDDHPMRWFYEITPAGREALDG